MLALTYPNALLSPADPLYFLSNTTQNTRTQLSFYFITISKLDPHKHQFSSGLGSGLFVAGRGGKKATPRENKLNANQLEKRGASELVNTES